MSSTTARTRLAAQLRNAERRYIIACLTEVDQHVRSVYPEAHDVVFLPDESHNEFVVDIVDVRDQHGASIIDVNLPNAATQPFEEVAQLLTTVVDIDNMWFEDETANGYQRPGFEDNPYRYMSYQLGSHTKPGRQAETSVITVPDETAVVFYETGFRAWLRETIPFQQGRFRADDLEIDLGGHYQDIDDSPAGWLSSILHELTATPRADVLQMMPGWQIEVVETCDAEGFTNGGAVLVLAQTGGPVRIASTWITARDFVTYTEEGGAPSKATVDAVVEAVQYAVDSVNAQYDIIRAL